MSYDTLKADAPPLNIEEVKQLLKAAPTSLLISREFFPDIVQTLSANDYINYTTIRDTFGIKARKRDFEEGKGIDPQTTRVLIDHFRAIQFSTDKDVNREQGADDIKNDNIPPSRPVQCARPEEEQELPDWLRKAEAHLRNSPF